MALSKQEKAKLASALGKHNPSFEPKDTPYELRDTLPTPDGMARKLVGKPGNKFEVITFEFEGKSYDVSFHLGSRPAVKEAEADEFMLGVFEAVTDFHNNDGKIVVQKGTMKVRAYLEDHVK